jgi:methyl-accepting chemotaxis protein
MQFRTKILILSTVGVLLTGLTIVGAVVRQESVLNDQITQEMAVQAEGECDKIAKDVYLMLRTQNESIRKKVRANLNVMHDVVVTQDGGVTFSDETASWHAINQATKQTVDVVLPKMLVSGEWLGQNTDANAASPVVDHVKSLVGDTCTIFQRMNDAGDML